MNLRSTRRFDPWVRTVTLMALALATFVGMTFAQGSPPAGESSGVIESFTVNLWDRIQSGGPVMVPIGLCSVIVLAFTLERLVSLRRGRVAPGGFVDDVEEVLRMDGLPSAIALCEDENHALARVVRTGLEHARGTREEVRAVLESSGQREIAFLRKNLRALSVTSAVAPLLGLLGTVGGMIEVFDRYAAAVDASDKVAVFSGGISKALVTTFAGLSVSIPATVIYHFFLARIGRFADEVHRAFALIFEGRVQKHPSPDDGEFVLQEAHDTTVEVKP
ncbi:MAG: MotA/TolQ/ExbB proton channel family protein [Planctomycetes bacterium]|nr:MotA/TolQ/ExbB proton channel family protein [Planctomycetota bacterium]